MFLPLLCAALAVAVSPIFASAHSLTDRIPSDSARAISMVDRGQLDSAHAVTAPLVADARASGDRALLARAMILHAATDMRIGHAAPVMNDILAAERLAEAARDTMTWMLGMRLESMGQNYLGRSDRAEQLAKRWLVLADAKGNVEYQAWARTMFGWLAWRHGDLPAARRELEWSLPRFEAMHHRAGEPYTLNVLANVLAAQGDYDTARRMLHRLLDLSMQYQNPVSATYALQNLGAIEGRVGDPAQSIAYHRRALEWSKRRGDVEGELVALSNIGELSLRIGRVDDAQKLARDAIALSEQHAMGMETPWHEQELADALWSARKGEEAKSLWRAVIARGDSVAIDPRAMAAVGLSQALADEDSLDAALLASDAMLARYPNGDEDIRSLLRIEKARVLLAEGRFAEALTLARKHAPEAEQRGNLEIALAAWTQVAQAARRTGARDEAARAVASATSAWERGRSRITDLEYRELRGEQARQLAVESVESALAAPDSSGHGTARAGFEDLQRFKTRTLLERMAGADAFGGRPSPWRDERGFDLAAFQREVLRPGELLLEYSSATDTTILFAITRDSCRVVRLAGDRDLRRRIDLARELFASPSKRVDAGEWQAAASALGGSCLAGVEDLVARSNAVIVAADGAIGGVPFALLVPAGSDQPLIAGRTVTGVPSATVLAAIRARASVASRGLFAFAGGAVAGHSPLPGADREVGMLFARFRDVKIFRTDRAPRATLDRRSLAGWSALHLAGHTVVNDQAPWRSGLVLGIAADGADSLLTAAEIASDTLGAPVVVLSGCESAGGRARSGEGVAGLTSAFLAAGAPAVIATLWPVDDRTTARLMDAYYHEIARGQSVAGALRAAQLALRADAATRHPFYWAGFVAIGEGEIHPALERKLVLPAAVLPSLVGAMVSAAVLWLWGRRRSSRAPAKKSEA